MGAKLLQDVRQDLADVVQVCEGKKKQTNYLRTLINELVKGTAPPCGPQRPPHPPHCAEATAPLSGPGLARESCCADVLSEQLQALPWGSGSEGPENVGGWPAH